MNKNKIIFAIIGVIIVVLVLWGIKLMNTSWKTKSWDNWVPDFTIWTYELDKTKMEDIVKDYKSKIKAYEKKNIIVENFSSYEDYKETLLAAIVAWKAPDVYMLSNSEKSFLENYASWIHPDIINPNWFRKTFKNFLWDELIEKWKDENWKESDFVVWIPVWYETLWIYFNRKFVLKPSDLDSWAWVSNVIDSIKWRDPDIIPLWIMNWKINNNVDVLNQFMLLSDKNTPTYDKVTEASINDAFWSYEMYIKNKNIDSWDNNTETDYYNPEDSWKTNLELFSEWDEAMIIGYTSMINSLKESGFNNSFLYAVPFPYYFSGKWKVLVKYNYFVVNKQSWNQEIAYNFLSYLATEEWARNFLSKFSYLLPAMVTLEQEKLQEKLHDSYNLTLGDFYKPETDSQLSSFDKWISSIYDKEVSNMITNNIDYLEKMKKLQKVISCKYKKLYNIENLSADCDLE